MFIRKNFIFDNEEQEEVEDNLEQRLESSDTKQEFSDEEFVGN